MPVIKPVPMGTLLVPKTLCERVRSLSKKRGQRIQFVTQQLLQDALNGVALDHATTTLENNSDQVIQSLLERIERLEKLK